MKLVFLLLLAIAAAAARCPDSSWVQVEDRCYWISEFVVPWSSVAPVCGMTGVAASPASVHGVLENANLKVALEGKQAWLGLSRPDASADWRWDDGSDVNFTSWDSGAPSSSGNCASYNPNISGPWGAEDCTSLHRAICQVTALSGCPSLSWTEYEGKCYWYSGDYTQSKWEVASATCNILGPWSQLASVQSAELSSFLMSLQTKQSHRLSGSPDAVEISWIGLRRANNWANWTWADGSDVDNRRSGELAGHYDCASLVHTGEWRSQPCSIASMPFYCQADL